MAVDERSPAAARKQEQKLSATAKARVVEAVLGPEEERGQE